MGIPCVVLLTETNLAEASDIPLPILNDKFQIVDCIAIDIYLKSLALNEGMIDFGDYQSAGTWVERVIPTLRASAKIIADER
jgi:hypothetical protein